MRRSGVHIPEAAPTPYPVAAVHPTECEVGIRLPPKLTLPEGSLMRARRILIAFSSLAVIAAGLTLTPSASADSVQVQSYQRASQTEACAAQPGETPWQASWGPDSSWKPSWEQWANGGTGGWTCTRSITWAKDSSCATGGPYALGDIGPGCGLVFLISGGLTYEMAPKNWNDPTNPSATDPVLTWCDDRTTNVSGASGTAVGTGAANTAAMAASVACSSNAAAAVRAYAPSGTSAGQWFLPSKDELNAMCNYSRTWTGTPSTSACTGAQNGSFASSSYGFSNNYFWSSSQVDALSAYSRNFVDGADNIGYKDNSYPQLVRPIRAF